MWRYRWSALLIAWVVAVVGGVGVYAVPDQFQAKAVVHIDTRSIMKPLLKGLAVESQTGDQIAVMSRILLSRENLLSVIRKTDMDLEADSPIKRERLIFNLRNSIILKNGGGKRRGDPGSNIYEISYQSGSAQEVYAVVSQLLNTFIEKNIKAGRTDTQMAQEFLDQQIAKYEVRLASAEQRLADFKKSNMGYMPSERGGYYTRLQRGMDSITELQAKLVLAQKRFSELRKQLAGESALVDSGSFHTESVSIRLRQYREELAGLLTKFTDKHPDVQALRSKINNLEEDLSNPTRLQVQNMGSGDNTVNFNPVYQEIKVELSKARIEIETLKTQLEQQKRIVEKLKKSVDAIPQVEAELAKLNRDYNVTMDRYQNLVTRREEARLTQEVGQSIGDITFQVLDAPVVPVSPVGPNRTILLVYVLLVVLGAGLGWSFLRYMLHPSFMSFRQVRDTLETPILGAVSLYISSEHKRRRRLQFASFLVGIFCLIGVFGAFVWYQDEGSTYVRLALSDIGLNL